MTYLVDTDWVAEYLKGRPQTVQTLNSLAPEGLAISLITFGEIYEGIYYGARPEEHEAGFRDFLRLVPVLPINRRTMQRFARIRGDLRRTGQIIGDLDLLIAATALDHGLTLVTHNLKHFQRVPELRLYQAS